MQRKTYSAIGLLQLGLIMLASSIHAIAQNETEAPQTHERMYQVELIVFSRPESNAQEHWPSDVKLGYPENLVSLKSDNSLPEGFSAVPNNERLLNPQAATLSRSGTYTLLYHQAWRQMIYGRKTNILIGGGKAFGKHQELEGNISLSVGQYLKIQTNLWLTQFAPAGTNLSETWPELPAIPNTFNESGSSQDYTIKRIVKVNQERSMRSNEVHYIDHPLLGIIIKIVPYETNSLKN